MEEESYMIIIMELGFLMFDTLFLEELLSLEFRIFLECVFPYYYEIKMDLDEESLITSSGFAIKQITEKREFNDKKKSFAFVDLVYQIDGEKFLEVMGKIIYPDHLICL
jgi:hypothetical protein